MLLRGYFIAGDLESGHIRFRGPSAPVLYATRDQAERRCQRVMAHAALHGLSGSVDVYRHILALEERWATGRSRTLHLLRQDGAPVCGGLLGGKFHPRASRRCLACDRIRHTLIEEP